MQGHGKLLTWTWSDEFLLFLNVLRGLGQVQPFIVEECLGVFPWNALNWLQLREGQQHLFVLHSWELEIVGSRQTNGCCQALLEVEQRSESKSWISWLIIGADYAGENVLWAVNWQKEEEVVWWLGAEAVEGAACAELWILCWDWWAQDWAQVVWVYLIKASARRVCWFRLSVALLLCCWLGRCETWNMSPESNFQAPNFDCNQVLWMKVVSGEGEVGARTAVVSSRTVQDGLGLVWTIRR